MDASIAALEAAFNNADQPDTRKTFGNVTYALIPVAVVEAVLDAAAAVDDADDFDERWEALGEDEPAAENTAPVDADGIPTDVLATTPEEGVEIGEPAAAIVAREVAVVTEPTDPHAAFPVDGSVEVAVPSDRDIDVEGLDGSFADGDIAGDEEE